MTFVKSYLGKMVDMSALSEKHATDKAVSNVGMNVRGDRITGTNKIIKTVEQADADTIAKNKQLHVKAVNEAEIESIVTKKRKDGTRYDEIYYKNGHVEVSDHSESAPSKPTPPPKKPKKSVSS